MEGLTLILTITMRESEWENGDSHLPYHTRQVRFKSPLISKQNFGSKVSHSNCHLITTHIGINDNL